MPQLSVGPLICNFVITITATILIRAMGIASISDAIVFGVITGLGFLSATTVNPGINPNVPRPFRYGAISGTYFFAAGVLIAIILVWIGDPVGGFISRKCSPHYQASSR